MLHTKKMKAQVLMSSSIVGYSSERARSARVVRRAGGMGGE